MAELSADLRSRALKIEAAILKALQPTGTQARVAALLGISESSVSLWKKAKDDGRPSEIAWLAQRLAALDLKVVPLDSECWPGGHHAHVMHFARIGFEACAAGYQPLTPSPAAPALSFDDGEA